MTLGVARLGLLYRCCRSDVESVMGFGKINLNLVMLLQEFVGGGLVYLSLTQTLLMLDVQLIVNRLDVALDEGFEGVA